jgi:hypothetical protein
MRQGREACKGICEIPGTRRLGIWQTDVRRAWYTGTKAGPACHSLVQTNQSMRPKPLNPPGVFPALPIHCLINIPLSPSHRYPDSTTPPVYTTVPFSPLSPPTNTRSASSCTLQLFPSRALHPLSRNWIPRTVVRSCLPSSAMQRVSGSSTSTGNCSLNAPSGT